MYSTGVPNDRSFHSQEKLVASKWDFLDAELKKHSKKISILDIGCSGGGKLLNLYRLGYRSIQGIDYADDVFREVWKKHPFLNINKGNAEDLSNIKNNSIDLAYASHLLEHLPNPDKCIKAVVKKLKKKGKFIIGIPNGYELNDVLMRRIQILLYGNTDHLQSFDKAKIIYLLESNNFKIKKFVSDWGSLEFLLDARLNNLTLNIPGKFFYKLIKKIYWKEIYFNIIAEKK